MKAMTYTRYGSPDVLQLTEVEKPIPGVGEVRVKIHAASVNSWDWDLVRGKPYLYRLLFGLFKPKRSIIGADIAGIVDAVGPEVHQFQPGDAVFGDLSEDTWGGFAEYVCAPEQALMQKPAGMTFEEAAATPQAAVLALQGLCEHRPLQPGHKVLINGAGGGVGTFAIQMAKSFGAEVTGVDSTEKQDLLRSIGADHVIDYTKEDFTKNGLRYDLIMDVVANRSIFTYKRSLLPNGIFVMVGGTIPAILQTALLGSFISGKKMGLLIHKANKDLAVITNLIETGKIKPVIDKRYPLSETAAAISYLGAGHARGKVVITV